MTKREANKLLANYCPFIKQQFNKYFTRKDSLTHKGHIYYEGPVSKIISMSDLVDILTFIQNIRINAINYYEEN